MSPASSRIELRCIDADVDAVGLATVTDLIHRGVIQSAWYADQTTSTNTTALERLRGREGVANDTPRLVLADRQSAGRGRMGRTWISDDCSLTFSLAIKFQLRDDDRSRWLSLAVGLAIAKTLESLFSDHPASLKWPNDVYLGGGKVAGVLLETIASVDVVVIGVGINVASQPTLSDANAIPPRCVANVVGQSVDRYELLGPLVESITATIDELREDLATIVHQYRKRCWLSGREVSFHDLSNVLRRGICMGVQPGGTLGIRADLGETIELRSGEVTRVRTHDDSTPTQEPST